MKKLHIKYGLISGLFMVAIFSISFALGAMDLTDEDKLRQGEIVGYLGMILSMIAVFLGIREVKRRRMGKLSFGTGVKNGTLIAVVAALIFGLYTIGLYEFMIDIEEFFETYYQEDYADLPAYYKSSVFQGFVMFATVFVIGFVVSLLSSLILKNSKS